MLLCLSFACFLCLLFHYYNQVLRIFAFYVFFFRLYCHKCFLWCVLLRSHGVGLEATFVVLFLIVVCLYGVVCVAVNISINALNMLFCHVFIFVFIF